MDIRKGMVQRITKMKTYCFIDASNLFYGGVKEMGWSVDHKKLIQYLKKKFNVSRVYYYGGIDTFNFTYTSSSIDNFPITEYLDYLNKNKQFVEERTFKKARFYERLKSYGFNLKLKPTKYIKELDGHLKRKANCDVDLTFDVMRLRDEFNSFILLSGDGDFLKLLTYFKEQKKEVHIIANQNRTASEIRKNFFNNFTAIERIRDSLEYKK